MGAYHTGRVWTQISSAPLQFRNASFILGAPATPLLIFFPGYPRTLDCLGNKGESKRVSVLLKCSFSPFGHAPMIWVPGPGLWTHTEPEKNLSVSACSKTTLCEGNTKVARSIYLPKHARSQKVSVAFFVLTAIHIFFHICCPVAAAVNLAFVWQKLCKVSCHTSNLGHNLLHSGFSNISNRSLISVNESPCHLEIRKRSVTKHSSSRGNPRVDLGHS